MWLRRWRRGGLHRVAGTTRSVVFVTFRGYLQESLSSICRRHPTTTFAAGTNFLPFSLLPHIYFWTILFALDFYTAYPFRYNNQQRFCGEMKIEKIKKKYIFQPEVGKDIRVRVPISTMRVQMYVKIDRGARNNGLFLKRTVFRLFLLNFFPWICERELMMGGSAWKSHGCLLRVLIHLFTVIIRWERSWRAKQAESVVCVPRAQMATGAWRPSHRKRSSSSIWQRADGPEVTVGPCGGLAETWTDFPALREERSCVRNFVWENNRDRFVPVHASPIISSRCKKMNHHNVISLTKSSQKW